MSQKKPIQFEEFHLYSIKRAEKRAEFNKKLKEKQEILNERKKQVCKKNLNIFSW